MRCSVRCIFRMGAEYETVNPLMNISMLIIIIYASVFSVSILNYFLTHVYRLKNCIQTSVATVLTYLISEDAKISYSTTITITHL
jgi:hypothetical protein